MKTTIQNGSLFSEGGDLLHSPLDEWTQAIHEFRASYLALNKTHQQLMRTERSSTHPGLCLESQPNQLLASMCQELVTLTREMDEPFNYRLLQGHTRRLQRLTQRATQLIRSMGSQCASDAEALSLEAFLPLAS